MSGLGPPTQNMNNQSQINLDRAIEQWREGLAQSPALRNENLDELESHLRDSIAMLQTRGLDASEAFLIATRRIGKEQLLEGEFRKINRNVVWLDRVLWILIAFQGWMLISTVCIVASVFFAGVIHQINYLLPQFDMKRLSDDSIQNAMLWAQYISPALSTVVVLLLGARLFSEPGNRLRTRLSTLLNQPAALALSVLAFGTFFQLTPYFLLYSWIYPNLLDMHFPNPSNSSLHVFLARMPQILIFAVLTLVVARKRIRTRGDVSVT